MCSNKSDLGQSFPCLASYIDVAVSYVENPSHFYVQSPHAPEVLRRLSCAFSVAQDLPVLAVEDIEKGKNVEPLYSQL